MSVKSELIQVLKPYYLVNIFLSLSYIIFKQIPGVCSYLFLSEDCEFDGRETEILFFLLIVIMIRTRKAGSTSMISYLSSSFIYTKIANLVLWFSADYLYGLVFGVIFILCAILIPEPTYSEPSSVIYFRDLQGLEEEISKNNTTWLVAFFTVWNPACANLTPVFSKLSTNYTLENFKFGKIDIGRYPEAGKKYHVSDSSMSKQLPTIILFKEGKEIARRPMADTKGKLVKFVFFEENIQTAFGLNNIYDSCKAELNGKNKVQKKND